MDELIVAALQGSATPSQERELLTWRQQSGANERYYQDFVETWTMTAGADDVIGIGSPPSANAIIRRADIETIDSPFAHQRTRRPARWGARIAAAAAVVLLSVSVWQLRQNTPLDLGFGAEEFVTGAGQTATVALRDGTVIRLAPESRLRLTGNLHEREVSLTGRAYFAVAHREGKPFRVRSIAGDVTVLGTRFDLRTDREDLRLVVVEGRVAVSARGHENEVRAGEMNEVVEGTLLPVAKAANVESTLDWTGRFLAFQSTPLEQVAREIERQYDVDVQIMDDVLAERTITTWLSDRSLEDVLRIVCAVAVAECSADDGVVTIQSQK